MVGYLFELIKKIWHDSLTAYKLQPERFQLIIIQSTETLYLLFNGFYFLKQIHDDLLLRQNFCYLIELAKLKHELTKLQSETVQHEAMRFQAIAAIAQFKQSPQRQNESDSPEGLDDETKDNNK